MAETISVPLHLLSITATNARKDHIADKAMIASLKSQGLLYPLLVKGIEGSESYDVIDGARRLTCILEGISTGELDVADFGNVPCLMNGVTGHGGLERSLHANLHMAMHPLDECEAILRLAEDEEDKSAIGLRFGQDEKWVDQRVKLASLCDEVKAVFRKGEISLAAAMKFTLGTPDIQKRFLKQYARDGFSFHMIEPAMTEAKVNARHVNFGLVEYQGPMERDLFGEDVWLADRKLVKELQDKWAADEIAALEKEGYDTVKVLDRDDWQTLSNSVEVTGRISAADRGKLACYLKTDQTGLIHVHKNRIARKLVDDKGKIKKKKHSADETPVENVKPQLCTELTVAQQEIVNALAASDIYTQVIEGNDLLASFLVVDRVFGEGTWTAGGLAHEHQGTINRWEKVNKAYPAEQLINGSEIEAIGQLDPKKLDYAAWFALPSKTRNELFYRACAALVFVPWGQQVLKKDLPELTGKDWLQPGEDFFRRYTTAQLIDYRKRSGDREAGATVKKKGDHVADCVVAATTPGAFKLGLYPKKLQIPAAGKKRKGGLPDEA